MYERLHIGPDHPLNLARSIYVSFSAPFVRNPDVGRLSDFFLIFTKTSQTRINQGFLTKGAECQLYKMLL
jgi:hypothetical protein